MYEVIITSIVAAIITYELNVNRGYGSVMSSSVVGLTFGILGLLFGAGNFVGEAAAKSMPFAAMGASFVGMSSRKVIPSHIFIAFGGAIFSFVFLFSSPLFAGLGGGLGITACIAVVATQGLMIFLNMLGRNSREK